MSPEDGPQGGIGKHILGAVYAKADLEVGEAQPHYILARDTIQTFLHEKIALLTMQARLLALAGIEATILIALWTADFKDTLLINADLIQGTFVAFAIIVGLYLAWYGKKCWRQLENLKVDTLADDLGGRGCVVKDSGADDAA